MQRLVLPDFEKKPEVGTSKKKDEVLSSLNMERVMGLSDDLDNEAHQQAGGSR
jgi:hypothetical protein